jgi:immunity protein 49 of polymorphic toxin system
MGLKLNKITDANAEEEIKDNLEIIPRRLAKLEASDNPSETQKHLEKLAELNFETGVLLYQQEAAKEEIVSHLRSAAEFYVAFLSKRAEPKEMETRFVGDFEKAIDLVVCFGKRELRGELAGIQRWQYNSPEHKEYRTRADFLEVEKRYIAEGVWDGDESERLENHCSSDQASKEERNFLLPRIRGIKAIAGSDQSGLQKAITDLVEAHKSEALRGEYRLMYEGLICLPALMLARLGSEKEMAVTLKSDYLPLSLLRGNE